MRKKGLDYGTRRLLLEESSGSDEASCLMKEYRLIHQVYILTTEGHVVRYRAIPQSVYL